jgi:nitric oxide reductase subunit B
MVLISVLPVGLLQTWASVEYGLWYARSADFLQTDSMNTLRWLRVVGDTIFALGILGLGWFVIGLKTGWSVSDEEDDLFTPSPTRSADATANQHIRDHKIPASTRI